MDELVQLDVINYNINIYNFIINKYKCNNNIYDFNNNLLIAIPKYSILIGDKIKFSYYQDIFKYLYIKNNNIEKIDRYPESIISIKNNKKVKEYNKSFY